MVGAIFGLASAPPLLLTFAGTRERPEFISQSQPKLRESLRAAVRNRPFVFAAVQNPQAVQAIRILMGPVPSVFLCAGIVFALLYPLSRDRHTQMRAEIAARALKSPSD